jgi:hypothetical protein
MLQLVCDKCKLQVTINNFKFNNFSITNEKGNSLYIETNLDDNISKHFNNLTRFYFEKYKRFLCASCALYSDKENNKLEKEKVEKLMKFIDEDEKETNPSK